MSHNIEREELRDEARIACALERIATLLETVVEILTPKTALPTALKITQNGDTMITGTQVGGNSTFQESFIPTNAALPAGQTLSVTWTCDDPAAVLAPSADGTSVVVSIPATDTQGSAAAGAPPSYNITATGTAPALTAPITSGPINVPILPTPAPLPTALTVNQLS